MVRNFLVAAVICLGIASSGCTGGIGSLGLDSTSLPGNGSGTGAHGGSSDAAPSGTGTAGSAGGSGSVTGSDGASTSGGSGGSAPVASAPSDGGSGGATTGGTSGGSAAGATGDGSSAGGTGSASATGDTSGTATGGSSTSGTATGDTGGTITGGSPTGGSSTGGSTGSPSAGDPSTGTGSGGSPTVAAFRGDDKQMPSFGGWAWGNVPADAVARAGFEWFETGYPGDPACNQPLLDAEIRPFAYINLGELDPTLASQAKYTGAILRTNSDWGTQLVDVTDASWQAWIVSRADYAYQTGSRGVKWDVATPDVPPGKTRDDVNAAIASMMQSVLAQHPDMKFIFNQGFEFASAYPQYVHAIETEGLFSASSYAAAYLQPWKDPWYWGPQYDAVKAMQRQHGTPIIVAEYVDPSSDSARALYAAITAEGFVPYITNVDWNIRGWGYNVPPGW